MRSAGMARDRSRRTPSTVDEHVHAIVRGLVRPTDVYKFHHQHQIDPFVMLSGAAYVPTRAEHQAAPGRWRLSGYAATCFDFGSSSRSMVFLNISRAASCQMTMPSGFMNPGAAADPLRERRSSATSTASVKNGPR